MTHFFDNRPGVPAEVSAALMGFAQQAVVHPPLWNGRTKKKLSKSIYESRRHAGDDHGTAEAWANEILTIINEHIQKLRALGAASAGRA